MTKATEFVRLAVPVLTEIANGVQGHNGHCPFCCASHWDDRDFEDDERLIESHYSGCPTNDARFALEVLDMWPALATKKECR